MMKITGLSHLFKWKNLHNWWLTKYFFAPLCIYIYIYTHYIAKSIESPPSNERFEYFSNFHEYKY